MLQVAHLVSDEAGTGTWVPGRAWLFPSCFGRRREDQRETGQQEEAEKDKTGDERRKRMKKVREEGMSSLFF